MLPPKLAQAIGIPHTLFRREDLPFEEVERRWALALEQMDGVPFHPTSRSWATGHFEQDAASTAHGAAFEIGRCYYWHKLPAELPGADELLVRFFARAPAGPWREALSMWLASLATPIPLEMDWRDRFYLEQRLGGWASATQRATDLGTAVRFHPANCAWIMAELLKDTPERRKRGAMQLEAIARLAPSLRSFPINPRPAHVRLVRWVKRRAQAFRARLARSARRRE